MLAGAHVDGVGLFFPLSYNFHAGLGWLRKSNFNLHVPLPPKPLSGGSSTVPQNSRFHAFLYRLQYLEEVEAHQKQQVLEGNGLSL